jgi:putative addiction module antidote
MQQKIIQIGNSTGIILPKSLLEELNLEVGSEVIIEPDSTDNSLRIVKKGSKSLKSSISPKFLDLLEKVNQNYGNALKELAQK